MGGNWQIRQLEVGGLEVRLVDGKEVFGIGIDLRLAILDNSLSAIRGGVMSADLPAKIVGC